MGQVRHGSATTTHAVRRVISRLVLKHLNGSRFAMPAG